ncbi:hypothetical protein Mal33_24540 [Rosistilla oblonga]|uniref:Uncharacterized protein n=1 Tax=Rosistilla oblonga TaxID=2527990 RepID=A0A518ITP6_9BACT|nr:hypothetical protein Mal33_24540 [Rosistilla oblonga]
MFQRKESYPVDSWPGNFPADPVREGRRENRPKAMKKLVLVGGGTISVTRSCKRGGQPARITTANDAVLTEQPVRISLQILFSAGPTGEKHSYRTKPMHELLVSMEYDLSRVLAPIMAVCDSWWWHLDDSVPAFPDDTVSENYSDFVTHTSISRIGHPGWCSRFIDFMGTQLDAYVGISSMEFPHSAISAIDEIDCDLFHMSPQELCDVLPNEVQLVCRCYSMSYYRLAFRSADHSNLVAASVPLLGPE